MSLAHEWDTTIGTAGTNGLKVKYCPKFFMELTPPQRIGLVLHEVLHCAFIHMVRKDDRDHQRWNMACDYVINLIIVNAGFELPPGGLLDKQYADMSADQVYPLLPVNEPPPAGLMLDLLPPEAGEGSADPLGSSAAIASLKSQMDGILVSAKLQAIAAGDSPGSIPNALSRHIELLIKPSVPWHRILSAVFTKKAKTGYSFTRANRRFLPKHIIPSRYSEQMADVAVSVDASSSVTDKQFNYFVSNTAYILEQFRPAKILFTQFTTYIKTDDVVTSLRGLKKINFDGRGGTRIDPIMEWARTKKPALQIIFTDGHFTAPSFNPGVPVVWIINDNPGFTAKFGKVIHFSFDNVA
jgi:predicted metal-dependent peptidase